MPSHRPRWNFCARAALLAALVGWSLGCDDGSASDGGPGDGGSRDGGTPDGGRDAGTRVCDWPAAASDVTAARGSANTLDLATWNIENFPQDDRTAERVADLVASMDLDLVAVQEIADTDAFDELVGRLCAHGYDGLLSSDTYGDGSYQKVGYIYKRTLMRLSDVDLVLTGDGYNTPRPPLQVTVDVDDGVHAPFRFSAIVVHLKAGTGAEDIARRAASMSNLEVWVRSEVDGPAIDEIVILGDFNEVLTSSSGLSTFAPFYNETTRYRFRTKSAVLAGGASFYPAGITLDHIITTAAFDAAHGSTDATIERLDQEIWRYGTWISDHVPVVLSIPMQ